MDPVERNRMRRVWGRIGGMKTKERLKKDPDYFYRTGMLGGEKTAQRGSEYYSKIGKMSGEAKRRRRLEANANAV